LFWIFVGSVEENCVQQFLFGWQLIVMLLKKTE